MSVEMSGVLRSWSGQRLDPPGSSESELESAPFTGLSTRRYGGTETHGEESLIMRRGAGRPQRVAASRSSPCTSATLCLCVEQLRDLRPLPLSHSGVSEISARPRDRAWRISRPTTICQDSETDLAPRRSSSAPDVPWLGRYASAGRGQQETRSSGGVPCLYLQVKQERRSSGAGYSLNF